MNYFLRYKSGCDDEALSVRIYQFGGTIVKLNTKEQKDDANRQVKKEKKVSNSKEETTMQVFPHPTRPKTSHFRSQRALPRFRALTNS